MGTVTSVAEARQIQKQVEFNKKVRSLHDDIEFRIDRLKDDDDPDLKDVNSFLVAQMEELLKVPIEDDETLEYVDWFFNYGDLRTEEEVSARDKDIKDKEYIQSGNYELDCKANKFMGGFIGFIIGFLLFLIPVKTFHDPVGFVILGIPVCTIFGIIFALIGMAIASSENIENAKEHNVPENHPRYQHDKRELALCGIAGVITTGAIAKKAHSTAKDIANVDGWREMK